MAVERSEGNNLPLAPLAPPGTTPEDGKEMFSTNPTETSLSHQEDGVSAKPSTSTTITRDSGSSKFTLQKHNPLFMFQCPSFSETFHILLGIFAYKHIRFLLTSSDIFRNTKKIEV